LIARIIRQLPRRAAAAFQARLKHPGAVRIRDIEIAQQQLADLARQLVEQGVISLPDSRHFAAAA
jgi:flagellar motor switch protein FliG